MYIYIYIYKNLFGILYICTFIYEFVYIFTYYLFSPALVRNIAAERSPLLRLVAPWRCMTGSDEAAPRQGQRVPYAMAHI